MRTVIRIKTSKLIWKRYSKSVTFLIILNFSVMLLTGFSSGGERTASDSSDWTQGDGTQQMEIYGLGAAGNILVAGSSCATCSQAYVLISMDSGTSWTLQSAFQVVNTAPGITLFTTPFVTFVTDSVYLFAGIGQVADGHNTYASTDDGVTWIDMDTNFVQSVNCFATLGKTLFAGTDAGVFRSTNYGLSWTAANNGLSYQGYDSIYGHPPQVWSMVVEGTNLFAGTTGEGIYRSTDDGSSWSEADSGLSDYEIEGLATVGTNIFAGTFQFNSGYYGGVFISRDGGASWSIADTGLADRTINCLTASGPYLFTGTNSAVFASIDSGRTWQNISSGAPFGTTLTLTVEGPFLLAGTRYGVWRYPLSRLTGIMKSLGRLPTGFALEQNYPNPFNPSTTIEYDIPDRSHVTLTVYDALGREVDKLVDSVKPAGRHSVTFDGSMLASGMYFYRIKAGAFTETKKLMVLK